MASMELMLSSSSSSSSTSQAEAEVPAKKVEANGTDDQYYLNDNFYDGVGGSWQNSNTKVEESNINMNGGHHEYHSSFFTTLMEEDQNNQPPKLEDFFGPPPQDTHHLYADHHQGQGHGPSLNYQSISGFLPASASASACTFSPPNSVVSEVDDSAHGESARNELVVYALPPPSGNGSGTTAITQSQSESESKISCKVSLTSSGQRTSIYRGVTRHRWTGRYEAHLWDNTCRREGKARKGRQVYLGGYDLEDKAARSYDLAALKYWGSTATTNLPASNYTKEIEEMKHVTKQEFIASLRRKSSGFSRGASIYRGVTRHHQQGRWQARIGRVSGNKDLYLGTFATEEEAAEAYDIAAIKFRGMNAVTNFEMMRYDTEAIMKGALPIGGKAKKLKVSPESDQEPSLIHDLPTSDGIINFPGIQQPVSSDTAAQPYNYHHNLFNLPLNSDHGPGINGPLTASSMHFLQPPSELFFWPHQSY